MAGASRNNALDSEGPDSDSEPESRDTVKPEFNVELYAEQVTGRERLATITDEAATEEARIASVLMDSQPPGPEEPASGEVALSVGYADIDALDEDEQLAFYRARLAPMTRVPVLTRSITELGPVIEDPKTAYVLGFVDGLLPLETIVAVAGLPEVDTLKVLDRAIEQFIVTFRQSFPDG